MYRLDKCRLTEYLVGNKWKTRWQHWSLGNKETDLFWLT